MSSPAEPRLRVVGTCPRCAARIELAEPVAASGRCHACRAGYLAVLPEDGIPSDGGELEVLLLPHGPKPGEPSTVRRMIQSAAPPLRGRFLVWIWSAGLGLVALIVLAWLGSRNDLAPSARLVVGKGIATLVLVLALPLTALLAGIVVRPVFGVHDLRAAWRTCLAVAVGATVLALAILWLPHALTLVLGRGWAGAILTDLLGGVLAGWSAARLGGERPYRHAVAVGLLFALGLALVTAPFDLRMLLAAPFYLVLVVPLSLGAWLWARFAARPAAR